jgi:hypothetical protein
MTTQGLIFSIRLNLLLTPKKMRHFLRLYQRSVGLKDDSPFDNTTGPINVADFLSSAGENSSRKLAV